MSNGLLSDGSRPDYLRIPPVGIGQRIALFGGTFNPPHRGHRHVALTGLSRLAVDQVWWLVTPGNPLKSHDGLGSLDERVAITRDYADHPRMVVTAFEANYNFRYTADTIAFMRRRFPTVKFVWLMGADNLATLHRWQKWREIMQLVPVAVVDRPGASMSVMSAPAAQAFAGARLPESQATALPGAVPPTWTFLHGPLDPTSSTAMRNGRRGSKS